MLDKAVAYAQVCNRWGVAVACEVCGDGLANTSTYGAILDGDNPLEALAYNLTDREGVVCAVMDARRSQLYNALFHCDGKRLERLTPDRLISAKELDNELSQYNESVYFCGDGCKVALEAVKSDNVKYVNTFATYQSAYSVARLALDEYGRGRAVSDRELLPVYLRASQAERERLEKEKNREVNNNG